MKTKWTSWTQAEIDYLKTHWANTKTEEIACHLGRAMDGCRMKAAKFGLKKSAEFMESLNQEKRDRMNGVKQVKKEVTGRIRKILSGGTERIVGNVRIHEMGDWCW
jgi:hypothetical protein